MEIRGPSLQDLEARTAAIATGALAAVAAGIFLGDAPSAVRGGESMRLVTYGNTILAGATTLYAVDRWMPSAVVGRAASAFAWAGSLVVLAALASSALGDRVPFPAWHEAIALAASLAVLGYLLIERAYRDRSAGFAVMMSVMAAVAGEMWLISQGLSPGGDPVPRLAPYWEWAHHLATCVAFVPLALAAALHLVRGRSRAASRRLVRVGWPLLAMATAMALAWAVAEPQVASAAVTSAAFGAAGLAASAWIGT